MGVSINLQKLHASNILVRGDQHFLYKQKASHRDGALEHGASRGIFGQRRPLLEVSGTDRGREGGRKEG